MTPSTRSFSIRFFSAILIRSRLAAFLTIATLAFAPLPITADEIIWNSSDSTIWKDDPLDPLTQNWWHSGSAAITGFENGDAVVFGRSGSGAPITGDIIAIDPDGVTIAASGTNPGMLIESGTWRFNGGALNGGGIRFTGNGDIHFDTRTLDQRITIDAGVNAALRVLGTGTLTLTSAATTNGGAIVANANSSFTASSLGSTRLIFDGNSTIASGGALYAADHATVTLNRVSFTGNISDSTADDGGGGAIFADNYSTLSITSGSFSGNFAQRNGGAIFARRGSSIVIENSIFTSNTAVGFGGAIAVWEAPALTLTNVSFINNTYAHNTNSGAVYINATQNGIMGHITAVAINVTAGNTSTYSGNTDSDGISTSIGFGGYIDNPGYLHTVGMAVDVGTDALLDMRDPMRVRREHPQYNNTTYDNLYITATKTGEGVWRLGGSTQLTGTAGNNITIQEGALALYSGASVLLDNQGSSPAALPNDDTFTLSATATLATLGINTAGVAATATSTLAADTITLTAGSMLSLNNSLTLSATTLNLGDNLAITAGATATLTLDQKSGALTAGGTQTYAVATGQTLTVAARIETAATTLTLAATNTTGSHSGTTTITAPSASTSDGGALKLAPNSTLAARATDGAALLFTSNTAQQGGAIAADHATLNLDGVSFANNTATSTATDSGGGAIRAANTSTLTTATGAFTGNKSGNHGGAILATDAIAVTIASSLFANNQAGDTSGSGNGGALAIQNTPAVTLTDVSFLDNTAGGSGGAVYIGADVSNITTNVTLKVTAGNTATISGNKDTAGAGARISGIYFGGSDSDIVELTIDTAAGATLDMQDPMGVHPDQPHLQISATKTGAGTWKLGGDTTLSGTGGNTLDVADGTLELYAGASVKLVNQIIIPAAYDRTDAFTLGSSATLAVSATTTAGARSYAGATIQADTITLDAGSMLSLEVGAAGVSSGSTWPSTGAPINTAATGTAGALVLTGSDFNYSAGDIIVDAKITAYAAGDSTITLIDATGMTGLTSGTLDATKFILSINGDTALHNNRLDVHQLQSTAGNTLDLRYHSTGNGLVTWTGSQNGDWDESARNWSFTYNGVTYDQFLNGDTVLFDNATGADITIAFAGVTIAPTGANPGIVVAGDANWSFSGGGFSEAATPVALLKQGSGTLTLSNTNHYTGGTQIDAGTLVAKSVEALGTGDITNKAALILDIDGDADATPIATLNQNIHSTGVTTKTGTGALASTGDIHNTLVVDAGKFVNTGNIIAAATVNTTGTLVHRAGTLAAITVDGVLNISTTTSYEQADPISGGATGRLIKTGVSNLVLGAVNPFSGATEVKDGVLTLAVTNALAQSSTVTIGTLGILDLGGLNQTLRTLKTEPYAFIYLDSFHGNFHTLNLSRLEGTGGWFFMQTDFAAGIGDRIEIIGANAGDHELVIFNTGDTNIAPNTVLPVVITHSSGATFSGATDAGMTILTVQQGDGGTIMPDKNTWYLASSDRPSRAATAILMTASVAGQDWHYELDSLHKRLGDLRATATPANSGNAWIRADSHRLNADARITGDSFHQNAYGLTIGLDKYYPAGATAKWYLGIFGNVSQIDRKFDAFPSDGKTQAYGAGAYLAWLHDSGWYADAAIRFDRRKNEFNAAALDSFVTYGKYDNIGAGLSLEAGRRIDIKSWWLEPSLQTAFVRINAADYDTASRNQPAITPIHVAIDGLISTQYRAQVRAGKNFAFLPSALRPYARLGLAYAASDGGFIEAGGNIYRAASDGWRQEYGLGAVYLIDPASQVYLDYEYAKATLYERPWSLNLGYRYSW